jgi:hypothetical protein
LVNPHGESLVTSWWLGQPDESWGVIKLLLEVWLDSRTKRDFWELLDLQFDRWVSTLESTKALGWIPQETDTNIPVTTFWGASLGQAIMADSSRLYHSPASVRDFFLKAAVARPLDPGVGAGPQIHGA